jgi:integrase
VIDRLGRLPGQGKLRKVQRGRDCPPVWVLDYTQADGSRKRIALSTDRKVAEFKQRELVRERDLQSLGLGSVAGQSKLLREVVEAYLSDLATRSVAAHLKNTRARLEHALAHLKAKRICELEPIAVLAYRAERVREGCSHRTANLHTDTLRSCLAWAEKLALIALNPLTRLPRLPENEATKRYRRRAMSEDEIHRFLAAAYEDDRRNAAALFPSAGDHERRPARARVPQAPLWRLLLEAGCRYGETIQATWADLDLDGRTLTLRAATTKAHKERTIPLLDVLVTELQALRRIHAGVLGRLLRPSDRIFLTATGCPWPVPTTNAMRIFDRLLEAAGIDRVNARGEKLDIHATRTTAATRFARAGVALVKTQKILGHSDPKLTARAYSRLDTEDLRDAVDAIAPKKNTPSGSHIA